MPCRCLLSPIPPRSAAISTSRPRATTGSRSAKLRSDAQMSPCAQRGDINATPTGRIRTVTDARGSWCSGATRWDRWLLAESTRFQWCRAARDGIQTNSSECLAALTAPAARQRVRLIARRSQVQIPAPATTNNAAFPMGWRRSCVQASERFAPALHQARVRVYTLGAPDLLRRAPGTDAHI